MADPQHIYESDHRSPLSARSLCGRDWRAVDPVRLAHELNENEPLCLNCSAVRQRRLDQCAARSRTKSKGKRE